MMTTAVKGRAYIIAAFVSFLGAFFIWYGGFAEADLLFLLLFLGVVTLGHTRAFLRDWTPFITLLIAWQLLRGYADNAASGLGFPLHNGDLIAAERWLFRGHLPNEVLQGAFYKPGQILWYDIAATSIWAFHFVLPILFAFVLWIRHRSHFQRFTRALLTLSFAAFATYVVFPAVPPWLASTPEYGSLIGPIPLIRVEVIERMHYGTNLSLIMRASNPDPVAAMPSLHAAYPALLLFFTFVYWRRVAPLILLYCCAMWTASVYIGDHYVIDILAGIAYAGAALAAVVAWQRFRERPGAFLSRGSLAIPTTVSAPGDMAMAKRDPMVR